MSWRRHALQLFLIKILHRLRLTRPLCRHGVKVESSSRWLTGIGMAPWTNERQDSLTRGVHFFSQRERYTNANLLQMALLNLNPVWTHEDVPHWFVDEYFKKPNILHHSSGHIEYFESSYSSKKPSCFVEISLVLFGHSLRFFSSVSIVFGLFTFTITPENLLLLRAVQSCCSSGENSNTSPLLCSRWSQLAVLTCSCSTQQLKFESLSWHPAAGGHRRENQKTCTPASPESLTVDAVWSYLLTQTEQTLQHQNVTSKKLHNHIYIMLL